MRRRFKRGFAPGVAALAFLFSSPAGGEQALDGRRQDRPVVQRRIPDAARKGSIAFVRTELYFNLHDQQSVLRVDDPYFVWVSF